MSQKIIGILFVMLLGTYVLTSAPVQSQDDGTNRSWRHLALSSEDQSAAQIAGKINQLGSDGWELVDVENFVAGGETVKTAYYFKKPE